MVICILHIYKHSPDFICRIQVKNFSDLDCIEPEVVWISDIFFSDFVMFAAYSKVISFLVLLFVNRTLF